MRKRSHGFSKLTVDSGTSPEGDLASLPFSWLKPTSEEPNHRLGKGKGTRGVRRIQGQEGRAPGQGRASRLGNGPVRVLFFGTPAIAVPALRALHLIAEVCGVVCQPDRALGAACP